MRGVGRAREEAAAVAERVLDRVAYTVVGHPLDVPDAETARQRMDELTAAVGNTATVMGAPWLVRRAARLLKKGTAGPSTAAIAATASTLTAAVASIQHLRVLASQVVHRLRAEGRRVDPAFVRRVAVGLYLDPSAGERVVRPNALAGMRLSAEWATHAVPFLRGRKTAARAHRAADAIAALDIGRALDEFDRTRAVDVEPRSFSSEKPALYRDNSEENERGPTGEARSG